MKKISKFFSDNLVLLILIGVAALCAIFLSFGKTSEDGFVTLDGRSAVITEATTSFIDEANELLKGLYTKQDGVAQMGSFPYYKVDVSTPTAFFNAVNGKGFNEGWGYQCVAGFKEFQYSLSGKVVATSTGGASGYAGQQSQIEPLGFTWHSGSAGLKDGDWGIFGGGQYGHVAMYYQGKWFGQNQGAADGNVGNAFNLLGLGLQVLGYYRPNIYETSETPSVTPPEPQESASTVKDDTYTVRNGDTMGGIMLYREGYVDWSKMNDYAKSWYSTKTKPGQSVYEGWQTGVGLYAGDIIEYRGL